MFVFSSLKNLFSIVCRKCFKFVQIFDQLVLVVVAAAVAVAVIVLINVA